MPVIRCLARCRRDNQRELFFTLWQLSELVCSFLPRNSGEHKEGHVAFLGEGRGARKSGERRRVYDTQAVIIMADKKFVPFSQEVIIVLQNLVSTNFQETLLFLLPYLLFFFRGENCGARPNSTRSFEYIIEETVEIFEFLFSNLQKQFCQMGFHENRII